MLAKTGTPTVSSRVMSVTRVIPSERASARACRRVTASDVAASAGAQANDGRSSRQPIFFVFPVAAT